MVSMYKTPSDYNGQPRDRKGRFSRGKQNGSRSKGRNLGAQPGRDLAGINNLPPIVTSRPNRNPNDRPSIGA